MALDKVTTAVITDDSVTGAKIENNPTVAGNLTVAGTSTLTGNATASGNLTVTGDIVPSTPLSNRNMIINGAMQVWQRATAATTAADNYHTVDRWKFNEYTDGAYTSEKHTMTLAELNTTGHRTALKLACTTADASLAGGQYAYVQTNIEGQDLQHLQYGSANAKTITLSFWVKSNKTGIYTILLRKMDSTGYFYPKEYTISSADTWEQKTITITPTAGSTSFITSAAGVIDNDTGSGIMLQFGLAWGSSYNTGTDNTWATSGYSTSNQVNWMDSTSNNLYITGVQLELGSSATPFEHRSYGDELARCQRYYQRIESTANYNNFYAGTYVSSVGRIDCGLFPLTCHLRSSSGLALESGGTWRSQSGGSTDSSINAPSLEGTSSKYVVVCNHGGASNGGFADGERCPVQDAGSATAYVAVSSEL